MSRARRTRGYGWSKKLAAVGLIIAALLIQCGLTSLVPIAFAAHDARAVTLGFGDRYGVTLKQHLGCDVSAAPGEEVLAPIEGVVSFVGWVPRDEGVRVRAVTIRDSSGALVSVSPLAQAGVSLGQQVTVGTPVGTVAEAGDPSTATPHVHVSLRVSDRYTNPAHLVGLLFAVPMPVAEDETPDRQPATSPQLGKGSTAKVAKASVRINVETSAVQGASVPTVVSGTVPDTVMGSTKVGVSQPSGKVATAPSPAVMSRSSFATSQNTPAQSLFEAGTEERLTQGVGTTVAPSSTSSRALVAWAIFGIGTALSVGGLMVGQSCRSAGMAGRLAGLFAVRGNR